MCAETHSKQYAEWLELLNAAIKQAKLSSPDHPVVRQAVRDLTAGLNTFFSQIPVFSVEVSREKLAVEGASFDLSELKVAEWIEICGLFRIGKIIFSKGLSEQTLGRWVELMSMKANEFEPFGGFRGPFEEGGFSGIRIVFKPSREGFEKTDGFGNGKTARKDFAEGEIVVSGEELRELYRETDQLADTEKRYKKLEEIILNFAGGRVAVDKAGKIMLLNTAARKMLGLEGKDGPGRFLPDLLKDEHLLIALRKVLQEPSAGETSGEMDQER